METLTMNIAPIQMFYWKIKFEDDFTLAQYDYSGQEILIKDITDESHWAIIDGARTLRKTSNLFSNIEKIHGRAVKLGWYPFDSALGTAITIVNPENNIFLIHNTEPHEMAIPANGYAYLSKEIEFDWLSKSPAKNKDGSLIFDENGKQAFIQKDPTGYQSDLYYGYLMREDFTKGEIRHARLNIKEKI